MQVIRDKSKIEERIAAFLGVSSKRVKIKNVKSSSRRARSLRLLSNAVSIEFEVTFEEASDASETEKEEVQARITQSTGKLQKLSDGDTAATASLAQVSLVQVARTRGQLAKSLTARPYATQSIGSVVVGAAQTVTLQANPPATTTTEEEGTVIVIEDDPPPGNGDGDADTSDNGSFSTNLPPHLPSSL